MQNRSFSKIVDKPPILTHILQKLLCHKNASLFSFDTHPFSNLKSDQNQKKRDKEPFDSLSPVYQIAILSLFLFQDSENAT